MCVRCEWLRLHGLLRLHYRLHWLKLLNLRFRLCGKRSRSLW